MIIDAHVQLGPGLRTDSPFQPAVKASTADEIVAMLERTGINRALVSPPRWIGGSAGHDFVDPNYEEANAAIADGVRRHAARLPAGLGQTDGVEPLLAVIAVLIAVYVAVVLALALTGRRRRATMGTWRGALR